MYPSKSGILTVQTGNTLSNSLTKIYQNIGINVHEKHAATISESLYLIDKLMFKNILTTHEIRRFVTFCLWLSVLKSKYPNISLVIQEVSLKISNILNFPDFSPQGVFGTIFPDFFLCALI